MAVTKEKDRMTIRQQVEITFPAEDVEHIIRCWVDHNMAAHVPKPKDLSKIEVRFSTGEDTVYSARVTYEPVEHTAAPK